MMNETTVEQVNVATKTLVSDDAKVRLILTSANGVWTAETRYSGGRLAISSDYDVDQALGECMMLTLQTTGQTYSKLFGDMDDLVADGF